MRSVHVVTFPSTLHTSSTCRDTFTFGMSLVNQIQPPPPVIMTAEECGPMIVDIAGEENQVSHSSHSGTLIPSQGRNTTRVIKSSFLSQGRVISIFLPLQLKPSSSNKWAVMDPVYYIFRTHPCRSPNRTVVQHATGMFWVYKKMEAEISENSAWEVLCMHQWVSLKLGEGLQLFGVAAAVGIAEKMWWISSFTIFLLHFIFTLCVDQTAGLAVIVPAAASSVGGPWSRLYSSRKLS